MKLHRIQIPPCRPYEINAAQSWLSDMSAVGLHPEQDFIFAGLAFFERGLLTVAVSACVVSVAADFILGLCGIT